MLTLILPYYRQPLMLRRQLDEVALYPEGIEVIVVDDGSPEPAADVFRSGDRSALYRIEQDIPWNRGGARNLGAHVAETDWIVHLDIDHVLLAAEAQLLLAATLHPRIWYRFRRWRPGPADETRRKDKIPPDAAGEVKPHIDSYACTRQLYWEAGGYDEDYSGVLGGGSPFLGMLELTAGPPVVLDIWLHVYTRALVPDASVSHLSRDTSEYKALRKRKGTIKGSNPLRFKWSRVF